MHDLNKAAKKRSDDKVRVKGEGKEKDLRLEDVGVVKDKERNLEEIESAHTLCGVTPPLHIVVYIYLSHFTVPQGPYTTVPHWEGVV